jgi:mono/diheme cytochrome c family protein
MGFRSQIRPLRLTAIACLLLPLVVLVLAWQGHPAMAQESPPVQVPDQPPSARNGHAIYQENCAPCHGPQGGGDGPTAASIASGVPALADPQLARQATPASWFEITKEGRMSNMMPPWKSRLTDAEIWDVVAFAFTLHTSQAELNRGQQVWAEQCAACHGDQGLGDGPQAIAGGWALASMADLAYVAGTSLDSWYDATAAGRGDMPGFASTLPEEDIWAAVEFARTFSYRPMVATSLPQGEGILRGTVSNGSPQGGPVSGLVVTLRPFESMEQLPTQEVTVGQDGTFSFEELPTGPEFVYLVSTTYNDVDFASDPVQFDQGTTAEAPLLVYEPSTTPGDISVALAQWFVDYQDGALLVGELYRINHAGDQVYVGGEEVAPGKPGVLRFDLPEGATSLALDGGELGGRFVRVDGGVVDTEPLAPGGKQILMRYLLPYSGTRAELQHSVPYPVGRFNVLVREGPQVTVAGLEEAGTEDAGDRVFLSYDATDVAAGSPVEIRFRNLARASAPAPRTSTAVLAYHPALLYGIAALASVTFLGVLVLAVTRGNGTPAAAPASEPAGRDLATERQRLLQAIADLDDRYRAGEMDQSAYESQRQALKRTLLVTTRDLDAEAATGASLPGAQG